MLHRENASRESATAPYLNASQFDKHGAKTAKSPVGARIGGCLPDEPVCVE
jgi:hypothetical protein